MKWTLSFRNCWTTICSMLCLLFCCLFTFRALTEPIQTLTSRSVFPVNQWESLGQLHSYNNEIIMVKCFPKKHTTTARKWFIRCAIDLSHIFFIHSSPEPHKTITMKIRCANHNGCVRGLFVLFVFCFSFVSIKLLME